LVFSPLDNRGPEKVPGARKIGSREKEKELKNDEKCQEKGVAFSPLESPTACSGVENYSLFSEPCQRFISKRGGHGV
jgi:hypothetical protein